MIQVSVSMTILYGIYWMFLKKDTFFSANRFYLLGSLIISCTISFFNFSWLLPSANNSYVILLDAVTIGNVVIQESIQSYLTTFQIILIIYLTGVAIFLLRYMFHIVQLLLIIYTNEVTRTNGISIITLEKPVSPFSFFNYIILPSSDFREEDIQGIIDHELIHVNQRHTIDILIMDLLAIIFWFNPVIWLFRSSLKLTHEYLADEGVLVKGHKTNFYQNLLLNQTLNIQVSNLTNNFNHSLIKRRFIMMSKSRSSTLAKLKLLLVLPAIMAIIIISMVSENVMAQEKLPDAPNVEALNPSLASSLNVGIPIAPQPSTLPQDGKKVFKKVDKEPVFPGGKKALYKYMQSSITYPKNALKKQVSGVVLVNFVIEKNGKVSDVTVAKAKFSPHNADKSVQKELIMKAISVVNSMPTWKPGVKDGKNVNVEMSIPVEFAMDNNKKDADVDIDNDVDTDVDSDMKKKQQVIAKEQYYKQKELEMKKKKQALKKEEQYNKQKELEKKKQYQKQKEQEGKKRTKTQTLM